jgi:hypothetical protein
MLVFEVIAATLNEKFSGDPDASDVPSRDPFAAPKSGASLDLRAKLASDQHVYLADGHELSKLQGGVTVRPRSEAWDAKSKGHRRAFIASSRGFREFRILDSRAPARKAVQRFGCRCARGACPFIGDDH